MPRSGGCWPKAAPRPSQVAIGYLERHGIGVRRDHNGTDRYQAVGGLVAVAFEHRISRAGDPNFHTHVLVQNAAQGPDGRWTALDSDRLYAQLMAADHLYLAAERAALTQRLGVRWGPVDERSGAAEIQGLDDRALIERFSKRSEEIDQWLDTHGLSGIKASSAAAVATRPPKDYSESEAERLCRGGRLSWPSRGWVSGGWPRSARVDGAVQRPGQSWTPRWTPWPARTG